MPLRRLHMWIGLLRGSTTWYAPPRTQQGRWCYCSRTLIRSMSKRSADAASSSPRAKRVKPEIPQYHLTPSVKDEDGSIQWPAPRSAIERARDIIREA